MINSLPQVMEIGAEIWKRREEKCEKIEGWSPGYYFVCAIISLQQIFMTIHATKWPENDN
jgi:hypothetical protein